MVGGLLQGRYLCLLVARLQLSCHALQHILQLVHLRLQTLQPTHLRCNEQYTLWCPIPFIDGIADWSGSDLEGRIEYSVLKLGWAKMWMEGELVGMGT